MNREKGLVNIAEMAIEGRAGREGVLLRLEKVWKDYSKWGKANS